MKRYKVLGNRNNEGYRHGVDEIECLQGKWVKYEDVKAILETNERLVNRGKALVGDQTLYDTDFGRVTGTKRP